jgi:hypothetical protein
MSAASLGIAKPGAWFTECSGGRGSAHAKILKVFRRWCSESTTVNEVESLRANLKSPQFHNPV